MQATFSLGTAATEQGRFHSMSKYVLKEGIGDGGPLSFKCAVITNEADRLKKQWVREEYVGLPIGKIPPNFAELFNALINIDESGLEEEGREWMKEGCETSDKMLKMVPSAILLGASTYQVLAARDRFAKKKSKESETEKSQGTSDVKKPVAEPPSGNHDANKSTA
ncbi:unnamed protein product [Taenia asiatica]|uniref:CMD domain-containing protein n=1 Tax=Taenia asiatica TaxID=60517 RepID=A0A158RAI3_TAEAS|nr:unnamed protein product [Taenia asiatica]